MRLEEGIEPFLLEIEVRAKKQLESTIQTPTIQVPQSSGNDLLKLGAIVIGASLLG